MFELITKNFMGTTITLTITGLPIVITGEVIASSCNDIIGLRLEGGNKIYISSELIATVY